MKDPFGEDIQTKQLFFQYLNQNNIENLENVVHYDNALKLFKNFFKDFIDYKLSLDDFSILCEKLWILLQDEQERSLSILGGKCLLIAELETYIRTNPLKAGEFLQEALEYYKKL